MSSTSNGSRHTGSPSTSATWDWFNFWLQGREDASPAKRQQYERWHALTARVKKNRVKKNN